MEKKERWHKILKEANIPNKYKNIYDGQIENVNILSKGTVWSIFVTLENPAPVEELFETIDLLRRYFINYAEISDVLFNFTYNNQNFERSLLSGYYNRIVNEMSKKFKSVSSLNFYSSEFLDNRINIYVGSEGDREVAEYALKNVRDKFKCYGFDKVEIEVSVSHFEIDTTASKEREISLKNQENDSRLLEETKAEIARREATSEAKKMKEQRRTHSIKLAIKDLPVTGVQIHEFKQIHSTDSVLVEGTLIKAEIRKAGNFDLFQGVISDYEDSITIKQFLNDKNSNFFRNDMVIGKRLSVKGVIVYDNFAHDVVIMCRETTLLGTDVKHLRTDESPIKRVELHAHSKMSTLDGVLDIEKYVETAKRFGHKAVAITDHANCHILPRFFNACEKHGIKPIAGVEGYYIDDERYNITLTTENIDLNNSTFVVFDLETTGFSAKYNEIIEIGAIKIKNGIILEEFSSFIKPTRRISDKITEITHITNQDVITAPTIEEVLPNFLNFIENSILVAHNATFDTGILYYQMKRLGLFKYEYPCIDTMQLAKALYSEKLNMKQFNLKAVGKALKVDIEEQHRALSDSMTTSNIFMRMLGDLSELGVTNYNKINSITDLNNAFRYIIPTHINILVKNKKGLKNFYKIISDSHTTHFHREARILKSVLQKYREGLLIGSGCSNGEIFRYAYEKSQEELEEKMKFYDYIEVQPLECYNYLIDFYGEDVVADFIRETIINIINTANKLGKIIVATGDVHELEPEDNQYRSIFLTVSRPGGGLHELSRAKEAPKMHFRTTTEMLGNFNFLSSDQAYKIVVENTNYINDMIESYPLFPKQLFTPADDFMSKFGIASMEKEVGKISYDTAHTIYGDKLPLYVEKRIEKELDSIIGNSFASIYYISHMLIKKSNENGYIVGSRGSVGSSFVATLMNITEVNPLKPHYVCQNCHYSAFKDVEQNDVSEELREKLNKVKAGQDLEPATCPKCGKEMNRDGIDIPFETFLGFKGDKTPDIDLNFSGEYQEQAHLFCREVFGIDNAFRAGTIGTVAEKTAFGYVRGYMESKGKFLREAEVGRIAQGLIDTKRTTGQHPGGIVVVPHEIEYTDIMPVQFPADSPDAIWRTSHYDYHTFENNLLKLDILGHDDPTMIKYLMDYVSCSPNEFPFSKVEDIPLTDSNVISLFSSKDILKLSGDDLDSLKSGTIGIPEFGTKFVRDILNDTQPRSFAEIVKVSGLSHGTDVWLGNARNLIIGDNSTGKPIEFSKVIGCRDDIMTDLISMNLDPQDAFHIMEHVRKGNMKESDKQLMIEYNVPEWYVESCQKIKYMFPKAHATAYVIMALRIGWFKVYRPIYYYSTYFTCRAKAFDAEIMASGRNAIRNKLSEIAEKIASRQAQPREIDLYEELQIALEMCLRGYSFRQVDIQKSDATKFIISSDQKSLYLPFIAVDALGQTAAASIVEARNNYPFTSKKDVEKRTKLNRTTFTRLKTLGAFDDLPDDDNQSLI